MESLQTEADNTKLAEEAVRAELETTQAAAAEHATELATAQSELSMSREAEQTLQSQVHYRVLESGNAPIVPTVKPPPADSKLESLAA